MYLQLYIHGPLSKQNQIEWFDCKINICSYCSLLFEVYHIGLSEELSIQYNYKLHNVFKHC